MYSNKYSKNIIEYTIEKYNLQLSRMNNEIPIFALVYNIANFDKELFNILEQSELKYEVYVFTNEKLETKNKKLKFLILHMMSTILDHLI